MKIKQILILFFMMNILMKLYALIPQILKDLSKKKME